MQDYVHQSNQSYLEEKKVIWKVWDKKIEKKWKLREKSWMLAEFFWLQIWIVTTRFKIAFNICYATFVSVCLTDFVCIDYIVVHLYYSKLILYIIDFLVTYNNSW